MPPGLAAAAGEHDSLAHSIPPAGFFFQRA
jgi:hypothetical protein